MKERNIRSRFKISKLDTYLDRLASEVSNTRERLGMTTKLKDQASALYDNLVSGESKARFRELMIEKQLSAIQDLKNKIKKAMKKPNMAVSISKL